MVEHARVADIGIQIPSDFGSASVGVVLVLCADLAVLVDEVRDAAQVVSYVVKHHAFTRHRALRTASSRRADAVERDGIKRGRIVHMRHCERNRGKGDNGDEAFEEVAVVPHGAGFFIVELFHWDKLCGRLLGLALLFSKSCSLSHF